MTKTSNVKIKEVWLNTGCCDDNGRGAILDIDLSNGQCIMLSLDGKISDPLFAEILLGRCREAPKTDGGHVYWKNGEIGRAHV